MMIDERSMAYYARLSTRVDELRSLHEDLYGSQDEFAAYCEMLRFYQDERRDELRQLDHDREENPEWYRSRKMLGYVACPQSFAGTLKDLQQKLEYLQENHITFLHLFPLLKSSSSHPDAGYAITDYADVETDLGSMDDLICLSDDCHSKGISLCADFVLNHTGDDHPWAKAAKAGDTEAQSRYFFFDDWRIPDQFERTIPQMFPQTDPGNFTWCEEVSKPVMTTFHSYEWDLNYSNPLVLKDITAALLHLCNCGVDIVRLDAIPFIWKELGTNCRHLPQTHKLIRILRLACEIVCPAVILLGEVISEQDEAVSYFGTVGHPECHLMYNAVAMASTWHTVATQDVRLIRHELDHSFEQPLHHTYLNYLRSHDDILWKLDYDYLEQFGAEQEAHKRFLNDYFRGWGYGSLARGELCQDHFNGENSMCGTTASLCGIEAAISCNNNGLLQRAMALDVMLHAFLMTQTGLPVIYAGDEIAQLNDYTYHDDATKQDDSRFLHRGKMNWDNAEKRMDANSYQGRLYSSLQELEARRRRHHCFSPEAEAWTIEPWNDHILAIGRYLDGEKLIALFNFSNETQTAWINEHEDYFDLLSGKHCKARAIQLPGYGFTWLLSQFVVKKDHN